MANMVLVTGGCRSGKSRYAQTRAEGLAGRHAYLATCPLLDEEMRRRIARHREERRGRGWETMEEQFDLAGALRNAEQEVLVVDCLALWVNNLMFEAERRGRAIQEEEIAARAKQVIETCRARPGTVVFVTNEVGFGIVPDNPAARCFRDLLGRCNQEFASEADAVVLMVCGLPVSLKKGEQDDAVAGHPVADRAAKP